MKFAAVSAMLLSTTLFSDAAVAQTNAPQQIAVAPPGVLVSTQPPSNVPSQARELEQDVEEAVKRFRVGVAGGVGFDPELIMFGAHATFAPVFHRAVEVRPGFEVGIGEVTTLLGINVDVIYTLPGATRQTRWRPYVGAGPTFGLSHRGFETDDTDNVETGGTRNRFDFSDTDFNGGMNFIAGARSRGGLFFELKATAWGVSNIRLLGGFNF